MGAVINADQLKGSFIKIEQLAECSNELAGKITEGIRAFERRLQSLKGRVAARVSVKSETDGTATLAFEQHGSEWKLVFGVRHPDQHTKGGGIILVDACVETQIRAVAMLPQLLDEMVRAHERRIEDLRPALESINELGINEVGLYAD